MATTTPQWLAVRGGELRESTTAGSWLVFFGNEPQYRLVPVPATGKFACEVMQTINGKRLESGNTYPSAADALRGGLEDLRARLGW